MYARRYAPYRAYRGRNGRGGKLVRGALGFAVTSYKRSINKLLTHFINAKNLFCKMKKTVFCAIFYCLCLACYSQNPTIPFTGALSLDSLGLKYMNGKPCKISDFRGKHILVDIWGQGCKPCVEAIPKLNELQKKYKRKLVILAINDLIFLEKLPAFIKKRKIKYKVVLPPDGKLMPIYYTFSDGIFEGFPNYTLIGKNGEILLRNTSYKVIETYLK
jgi:thiol-disulfide isomerase/thioredoxin